MGRGSSVGKANKLQAGESGDRNLMGKRFTATVPTEPGVQPASRTKDTRTLTGVKSGRGQLLNSNTILVQRSRKNRAKTPLPVWAECIVERISTCTVLL